MDEKSKQALETETPLAQVSWVADASREEPEQAVVRKWTPGPWTVHTMEPSTYGVEWVSSFDVQEIALCSGATRYKGGFPCHMEDGETKANAHLIAAAPELYEALEFALEVLTEQALLFHNGCRCQLCEAAPLKINAALAKARDEGGAR